MLHPTNVVVTISAAFIAFSPMRLHERIDTDEQHAFSISSKQDPSTESEVSQLRAVWSVGSQWNETAGSQEKPRVWTVDWFDGDLLTISHSSDQASGRVAFTLEVAANKRLTLVDTQHQGATKRVVSRNHSGRGTINRDGLTFNVRAKFKEVGSGSWSDWNDKHQLRRVAPVEGAEILAVGAIVDGMRTEPKSASNPIESKMRGKIIQHDDRWLVIRVKESFGNVEYDWRFERDGKDSRTGEMRWAVRDGEALSGEPVGHRFNWRGYVVLKERQLVGRYGFDWLHMKKLGHRPGTDELSHPIVLTIWSSESAK